MSEKPEKCLMMVDWDVTECSGPKCSCVAPPVDNEHVAEGCERFGFPKDEKGKPILTVIK